MAGWMACPECGKAIRFRLPEEQECSSCGWSLIRSQARALRKQVHEMCLDLGENYWELLEEFGDDEVVYSYLHADDPDEYRDLFHEFGGDAETVEGYLHALDRDD
jgi:hypothetical protein